MCEQHIKYICIGGLAFTFMNFINLHIFSNITLSVELNKLLNLTVLGFFHQNSDRIYFF